MNERIKALKERLNNLEQECRVCRVDKRLSEFAKMPGASMGVDPTCKVCRQQHKQHLKSLSKDEKIAYAEKIRLEKERKKELKLQQEKLKGIRKRLRERSLRYKKKLDFKEWWEHHCISNSVRMKVTNFMYSNPNPVNQQKAIELMGCDIVYLKAHLAKQFTEDMSFDNYGEWHVDHIAPCSAFDLRDPEQVKICFHYTNLQPLWAKDNMKKGGRITKPIQMHLPLPVIQRIETEQKKISNYQK